MAFAKAHSSWRDLLLDLKRRGLTTAPQIAVAKPALAKAGGALGFWKALGEVWPTTREQRCWVHKTANILNKLPKSLHTKAKRALQGDLDGREQEGCSCGVGSNCSGQGQALCLGLTRFGGHPESLARGAADAKNTSTVFAGVSPTDGRPRPCWT